MTLFFLGAAVFNLAYSLWSIDLKEPLLKLVIRAKKNCVTYFEPDNTDRRKPEPDPKYGEKVKLTELFDHPNNFEKVKCRVCGRVEVVSITALNLLWKPTGTLK